MASVEQLKDQVLEIHKLIDSGCETQADALMAGASAVFVELAAEICERLERIAAALEEK